jgi:membrane fusion protein, multidrug efflux system
MKNINIILSTTLLAALIIACGGKQPIEKKRAELEQLKTKQAEIAAQITALQDEIAKLGDTAVEAVDNKAKIIAVTPITAQPFLHAIDVQGEVDGEENVTYSAKAPSTITKINVSAGDRVVAGQVLAELDNKSAKSQLEALKIQYELANTLFLKQKALWEQKIGSEVQFLTAKSQKEGLEKQIQSARENLDNLLIKADYNGTIDEVKIKIGQSVAPSVPCITVVNPDKLKIKANLSESYASIIKTGNAVSIHFPDIDKNINSQVTYSSKSINALTRTFNVEVNLPNDNDLHPNMIAEVKIIDYKKEKAIVVPINAVQEIDGTNVVFIAVKNGNELIAKKIAVTVGKTYNSKAEILNGLSEGDQLITTGFQDLTDGQTIKL